jgi:GNAT superfamily N-acetyltransferase
MDDKTATAAEDQLDDDTLAWGYAMNLGLIQGRDSEEELERAEYQRRFDDYAQTLLYDLHADPDRLVAVADHHRARAEASKDHPGANRIRLLTVELAEAGLSRIRAVGAVDDPEARDRLYTELKAANSWSPSVYRQGPLHQHRAVRRILRRTNPAWWIGRLDALVNVALDDGPSPDDPNHTRRVTISHRGLDIGRLDYRVCPTCRIGFVAKISVDEEYQDRGIATRALAKTRSLHPGFQWCTSGQYTTARTFWVRVARKSGERYLPPDDQLRPCSHIDQ